jgi:C4-dicarboxylate-specific signal transduction histidine kinase
MKIEYKDKFLVFSNELKQVILNLIKNAEDVLSETNLKHKKINIKIYKKENIIFEIEDNGGGIKEDISDKIFEPYFSTKDKNGTGIGLYMSNMIVQKHLNGELIFQNTDNGVLFKIILKEEK